MEANAFDPQPIWLTLQLASVTVLLLLLISLPIAWWLAHTKSSGMKNTKDLVVRKPYDGSELGHSRYRG